MFLAVAGFGGAEFRKLAEPAYGRLANRREKNQLRM
jgi:hypothetical protein